MFFSTTVSGNSFILNWNNGQFYHSPPLQRCRNIFLSVGVMPIFLPIFYRKFSLSIGTDGQLFYLSLIQLYNCLSLQRNIAQFLVAFYYWIVSIFTGIIADFCIFRSKILTQCSVHDVRAWYNCVLCLQCVFLVAPFWLLIEVLCTTRHDLIGICHWIVHYP